MQPYFGKANRASLISPSAQPTFAQSAGHESEGESEAPTHGGATSADPSLKAILQLSCTPKPSWVFEDSCATAPPAGLRDRDPRGAPLPGADQTSRPREQPAGGARLRPSWSRRIAQPWLKWTVSPQLCGVAWRLGLWY